MGVLCRSCAWFTPVVGVLPRTHGLCSFNVEGTMENGYVRVVRGVNECPLNSGLAMDISTDAVTIIEEERALCQR